MQFLYSSKFMNGSFRESVYWLHIRRILILAGIYSLCRLLFFFLNYSAFQALTNTELSGVLLAGIRFDLSAILTINLPYLLLVFFPAPRAASRSIRLIADAWFLLLNGIALFSNCADMIYFRYVNSRSGSEIFKYLGTGNDFSENVLVYIRDFWIVLIVWILLLAFVWRTMGQWSKRATDIKYDAPVRDFLRRLALFVVLSGIIFTGIRGGWQKQPISVTTAVKYAGAQYAGLIINTPFNLIKTFGREGIAQVNYFADGENEWYSPLHTYSQRHDPGDFTYENVVVVILESFAKEYSAYLRPDLFKSPEMTYTPFLDSLMRHSLVFPNAYANALRSIDALPAVVASIPQWMGAGFILSPHGHNHIHSLPLELNEKGYTSYFFHGGSKGTMAFDTFSNIAGFHQYHGRSEYNNDAHYDGHWGIFDEHFLQYAAKVLEQDPQPFFATIFTLSSHHPYNVPAEYSKVFLPGKLGIHKSVRYADYSLKRFFETASGMPWYRNTLFVITADHTETLEYQINQNRKGIFEIPLLLYHPESLPVIKNLEAPAQQVDIMPTVLDYLGYDRDFLAYGESLLDENTRRMACQYLNNIYQIIDDRYLLQFDGDDIVGLFDWKNDPGLRRNLQKEFPMKAETLCLLLKARIQEYNNRLALNRMIHPNR